MTNDEILERRWVALEMKHERHLDRLALRALRAAPDTEDAEDFARTEVEEFLFAAGGEWEDVPATVISDFAYDAVVRAVASR